MKFKTDYHDYIIKNGKFIGKFEEMYKNIDDPWNHGDAAQIHYDIALLLLKKHKICKGGGTILDIGCGKGAFTSRIKKNLLNSTKIVAIDIAPTAIRKAKEKWGYLGIEFRVCDIIKEHKHLDIAPRTLDLIVMSDLIWYIPNALEEICQSIRRYMKDKGYLLINQTFYSPEKEFYGKDIISCVEDLINIVPFKMVEMTECNRLNNHNAVLLFRKEL